MILVLHMTWSSKIQLPALHMVPQVLLKQSLSIKPEAILKRKNQNNEYTSIKRAVKMEVVESDGKLLGQ